MGEVVNYENMLLRVEAELTEWDQEIARLIDDIGEDELKMDEVMELLGPDAEYYLSLIAMVELLRRWVEQDQKFGAYRRGVVFTVGRKTKNRGR